MRKNRSHKQILSEIRGTVVYSINDEETTSESTEISFLGVQKQMLLRPFELMKRGGVIGSYEFIETRSRILIKRLTVVVKGINNKIASLDVIQSLVTQQLAKNRCEVKYCKSFEAFLNL